MGFSLNPSIREESFLLKLPIEGPQNPLETARHLHPFIRLSICLIHFSGQRKVFPAQESQSHWLTEQYRHEVWPKAKLKATEYYYENL